MQIYGIPLKDDRISPIFYNFAQIINKIIVKIARKK